MPGQNKDTWTTRDALPPGGVAAPEAFAKGPPLPQDDIVAQFPGTVIHRLETSHSPFYSQPAELVRILQGAV